MKRFVVILLLLLMLPTFSVNASDFSWNFNVVNGGYVYENKIDLSFVTVAVIDSGLDIYHEDLKNVNIVSAHNFIDGDEDDISDDHGHGTFVTSVIAAEFDNKKGNDGLACGVNIMPLKIYSDSVTPKLSNVIKAIEYAVDNGADVINISLGVSNDVPTLRSALKKAYDLGIIVVAAVGNDGMEAKAYPAAYDFVVGVGSVNSKLEYSEYSRYNDSVFVTAPGERVYTAAIDKSNSYAYASGSSFASPHVASLAAIAKAYDKRIDCDRFKDLLSTSSKDLGEKGYDIYYGHGLIDFKKFINVMSAYDLNYDGNIDSTDILLMKKIMIKTVGELTIRQEFTSDVDDDGAVTVTDYIFFKRKLMRLI